MADDFLVRLLVVLAAAGAVAAVAVYRPQRSRTRLEVEGNLAGPGVYFITAAKCDACDEARRVYREVLGESGFTELSREEHPDLLDRIGVRDIPAGVVVGRGGKQLAWFTGTPRPRSLRRATREMGE